MHDGVELSAISRIYVSYLKLNEHREFGMRVYTHVTDGGEGK